MKVFVRLANWGHRQDSIFVRRGALILAIIGLSLWQLVWWLALIPLFVICYAPVAAVIAFFKAILEILRLTGNQLFDDIDEWKLNMLGAIHIWRARKIDPVIIERIAQ